MNYEVKELLQCLPPYQDQWEVIHPGNQEVPEIIDEVIEAHYEFAPYYDKISSFFDVGNIEEICNNLYRFVKNNISYREESVKDQTSALPTGILTRRQGDCVFLLIY